MQKFLEKFGPEKPPAAPVLPRIRKKSDKNLRPPENLVDSENPRLYSEDGLLYGKKKTMPNGKARLTLIAVPPDKKGTVEIAPSTEMIAGDAFTNSKASKVILPKTVTAIVHYAVNKCENLREVVLNEGLTHIGEYAFRMCPMLDNITIPDTVLDVMYHAFSKSPLRNLKFQNRPQKCNNRLKIAYGAFGWCHADEIESFRTGWSHFLTITLLRSEE